MHLESYNAIEDIGDE
jgi:hypothetical protein